MSSSLNSDSRLDWRAALGRWRLLRIGYTLTGGRTSTHREGWDDPAIDDFDPRAFNGGRIGPDGVAATHYMDGSYRCQTLFLCKGPGSGDIISKGAPCALNVSAS